MRRLTRRCCCAFSRKKTSNSASPTPLLARFRSSGLLSISKLKSQLKGNRFQDISTIQANVTEQIRSIPKDSFKKSFQSDYVENWGNKCFLIWFFYFLLTWSGNFLDALCICSTRTFNPSNFAASKCQKLKRNLQHSKCSHEILYADRSSKVKQV
jgi:hypothetical protein